MFHSSQHLDRVEAKVKGEVLAKQSLLAIAMLEGFHCVTVMSFPTIRRTSSASRATLAWHCSLHRDEGMVRTVVHETLKRRKLSLVVGEPWGAPLI